MEDGDGDPCFGGGGAGLPLVWDRTNITYGALLMYCTVCLDCGDIANDSTLRSIPYGTVSYRLVWYRMIAILYSSLLLTYLTAFILGSSKPASSLQLRPSEHEGNLHDMVNRQQRDESTAWPPTTTTTLYLSSTIQYRCTALCDPPKQCKAKPDHFSINTSHTVCLCSTHRLTVQIIATGGIAYIWI